MQEVLKALGFSLDRSNRHPVWERPAEQSITRKVVPLDDYPQFEQQLIKRIIRQTGFTREQFYGATPKTAKKIR